MCHQYHLIGFLSNFCFALNYEYCIAIVVYGLDDESM